MEPRGSESQQFQQSQLQPGRPRDRYKGQPSQIPSYKCRFPWPPSLLKCFPLFFIHCQFEIRSCNCNNYKLAPALPRHAHNRPRSLSIRDSFFCERLSSEGGEGERDRLRSKSGGATCRARIDCHDPYWLSWHQGKPDLFAYFQFETQQLVLPCK